MNLHYYFFFLSVMAHCSGRGDELFVGDIAHITIWEQGGVAQVIFYCAFL